MREKILNRRLGESGHFFVLDRSNGKTRGQYLFHAGEEGSCRSGTTRRSSSFWVTNPAPWNA
jgi:hypothetical protein